MLICFADEMGLAGYFNCHVDQCLWWHCFLGSVVVSSVAL